MSNPKSFAEKSYESHYESFREHRAEGSLAEDAKTWFETDTVDAWRHQRMYQAVDPLLQNNPGAKWLTVGDGRYGKDAKYLLDHGGEALPTDISDFLLKEAKEMGFIPGYQRENAEKLSFPDGEFDYVFCKEAYHHFPRPAIALYEMLRVARKAVVLIEPNDLCIDGNPFHLLAESLKRLVKFVLRRNAGRHSFEDSGNYVFCVSRREIEKVALGMNYRMVAFKGMNDAYFPGVEKEKLAVRGPLQRKVKRHIGIKDFLCKLGLMDYLVLGAILFAEEPSAETLRGLREANYKILRLPENPYHKDA